MRLVVLTALLVVAVAAAVGLAVDGLPKKDDNAYKVRAIFDSAFSVIPGEDVRVAGVTVGAIDKLDVTRDNKAVVVLRIDQKGFADFRKDATCQIRPQSLIGERFVECNPTQPRPAGTQPPAALAAIPKGQDGAGQHLLPVSQTGKQIDLDLLNNIMRLPYRQRFSILLNEFGTALAGNGQALNRAIKNADPALRETDRVLAILAGQNKVLADLARDSDTDLAPLADRRRQVADFVVKANRVARATADRRVALQEQFQKFPPFLRQLRPTLTKLGQFADQATPVFADLRAEAPSLTRFAKALGPFSESSIPAFESLGQAADIGKVAVPKTKAITEDIAALAKEAQPLAANLRATLESVRDTGGIERLMDYIFFQVAAINGYDTAGHYLRAGLIVNTCSTYVTEPTSGCTAKFGNGAGAAGAAPATARAAAAHPTGDKYLDRTARILSLIAQGVGADAAVGQVLGSNAEKTSAQQQQQQQPKASSRTKQRSAKPSLRLPATVLPGGGTPAPAQSGAAGQKAQPTAGAASNDATGTLLDYLLGDGS
jgi:ABC-type transporter Mla subunit MlaD